MKKLLRKFGWKYFIEPNKENLDLLLDNNTRLYNRMEQRLEEHFGVGSNLKFMVTEAIKESLQTINEYHVYLDEAGPIKQYLKRFSDKTVEEHMQKYIKNEEFIDLVIKKLNDKQLKR